MVKHLRLENFAIVDKLDVELAAGLVALTGETGAGKSILIHALEFALGDRATVEVLRHGADRCVVDVTFEIDELPEIQRSVEDLGASWEPGDLLVLRRELRADGKGRAWINGAPVQVRDLRRLGEGLVDIHGQHEHQSLLKPSNHQVLLDAFGGCLDLAKGVGELRRALDDVDEKIRDLEREHEDRFRKIEFLRHQVDEIEKAGLSVEEEENLEAEKNRLSHAEKLAHLIQNSLACLAGHDASDSLGARDLLAKSVDLLEEAGGFDPAIASVHETCVQACTMAEDVVGRLQEYADSLDANPNRLDEVEGRLALIARLKRKYNGDLSDILVSLESFRAELSQLSDVEISLPDLRRRRERILSDLAARAQDLSLKRADAALLIGQRVSIELRDLGLEKSAFEVSLEREDREAPGAHGWETVEFMFTANPGEPARPLRQVASGGELSRVMMCLKTVLACHDRIPSLVFDEVDANVGGRLGFIIGQKLRQLSSKRQILCITHLPQIAAMANHHLHVVKDVTGERPLVSLKVMEGEDRVQEIAQMIAGPHASDVTLNQAKELLGSSENL